MIQRFFVLFLLAVVVISIRLFGKAEVATDFSPTFALGFMLLASYCLANILNKFNLPKLTAYIIVGLLIGPHLLSILSKETIDNLEFINSLALSFIAFTAGGEIKFVNLRSQITSIVNLVISQTIVIFLGVFSVVFFLLQFMPYFTSLNTPQRISVAMIFAVICVARSPSSAIAIISETKAKGQYTDIILSVTVLTDVVVIIIFGIVVSLCQLFTKNGSGFDWVFFFVIIAEISVAFGLGYFLGKGIIYLITNVKVEFPVVMIGIGFIVIKFSHLFSSYLHEDHNIAINLEPLLICMAAGYTVQNFSAHGKRFLMRMDSVSLPIYIIFFTVVGATIDINILKASWIFGLVIVIVRLAMLHLGSIVGGIVSRAPKELYQNYWLGFITQAGVSLGLLTEIVRRFPTIGIPIQSLLIAAITINQLIGPIAFKYVLIKVGDSKKQPTAR